MREAALEHENDDILVDIARSRERARASYDVPGVGLAMCGVGYDMKELAVNRHMKKCDKAKILNGEDVTTTPLS